MLNLLIFQFRCGQLMSQPNNGCDFHLGNQLLKISILISLCFSSPKKLLKANLSYCISFKKYSTTSAVSTYVSADGLQGFGRKL